MQTKKELEKWYSKEDPWNYRNIEDDQIRKEIILGCLDKHDRALDIGCGEGFITEDLPAKEIWGWDISDKAMERMKPHIKRGMKGKYDLIIATGVLYKQYDWKWMIEQINKRATDIILTCNIADWELGIDQIKAKQVAEFEFPYRVYVEKLRMFKV